MHQRHSEPSSGSPLVLVIDDEPLLTLALAKALADEGFQVVVANDGAEGLARTREHGPSLIILDLNMPIMDGYQFIESCRLTPDGADIPIIVATGANEMARARQRIQASGNVTFVAKPFDLEALLAAVETLTVREAD
jgi:CheY-like chemotaxis protein